MKPQTQKTPIPRRLMKFFNSMSEANDKIIESGRNVQPMCFLLNKDNTTEIIAMQFRDNNEKIIVRNKLFKHIAQKEVIGYFLFQDALMTKINSKTGESEITDVVMRTLFTPKRKYAETISYKNGKIINKQKVGEEENLNSIWNIWETIPTDEKSQKDYNEFKKSNPERYRSVE